MPNRSAQKPMPASRVSNRKTMIVGHRGAAGLAPENTLAAFQVAQALNLDGVEFDVQRSADGQLVTFHDEEVDRTTDSKGLLRQFTVPELKALDAGSWMDSRFSGERIVTLEELFDFMKGNNLLLFLEIKDPFLYPGIEHDIAAMIRRYDFIDRTQVRSFFHPSLHSFHKVAPEISISELWYDRIPTDEESHFNTVNVLFSLYTKENLAEIHARGQKAEAWTVNSPEIAKELIEWGVDALATDVPDQLLPLVGKT